MRKRLFFISALLLALALLLCACSDAERSPLPIPKRDAHTPCPHEWKDGVCTLCGESCPHLFEDGVCTICGAPCPHEWQDGVCTICGLVCPHERHDKNAVCLLCGTQCWHSYAEGRCTGCGREPLLYTEMLPERYLKPAEHQGTCLTETLTWQNERSYPMSVYLPYGYDEQERYNLVIFLLGDNSHASECTDALLEVHGVEFKLCWIYDHMLEEHLCAPFILVGVEHLRSMYDIPFFETLLRTELLPQLARDYATWIDGEGEEAIRAARDHIALCGASRGARFALQGGLGDSSDLVGNVCCMSVGDITESEVDHLNTPMLAERGVHCFLTVYGTSEPSSWSRDRHTYFKLVREIDCLQDGKSAFSLAVHDGHNWVTWSAGLFAALQYMF